jgi:hypothetical protein
MKEERTEWFRKWATLVVSTVALLVACLREPLTLTLKATVLEVMREELAKYETVSASDARCQKHQDSATEVLKRYERELSGLRDLVAAGEAHGRLLMQVSNRLSSLEAKLEELRREH